MRRRLESQHWLQKLLEGSKSEAGRLVGHPLDSFDGKRTAVRHSLSHGVTDRVTHTSHNVESDQGPEKEKLVNQKLKQSKRADDLSARKKGFSVTQRFA